MTTDSDVGGRPPHEPTNHSRATVETFAAFGIPQDDIARVLGITKPTLAKYYRDELDLGKVKAIAKVASNLFTMACKPTREGLDAAKFYLRMQAGWSEYAMWRGAGPTKDDMPIGKKEQANIAAETAHEGTDWVDLVKH